MWRAWFGFAAGLFLVLTIGLREFRHNTPEPWLLYQSDLDFYRANADGSNPVHLMQAPTLLERTVWSEDGEWLYTSNQGFAYDFLVTARPHLSQQWTPPEESVLVNWSPDKRWQVYERYDPENITQDIFWVSIPDGKIINITQGHAFNSAITWSPDGKWLIFEREENNDVGDFYRTDGTVVERLLPANYDGVFDAWSPNGEWFYFWDVKGINRELFRVRVDGSGLQQITQTRGADVFEGWSPDGEWFLFTEWSEGISQIYRARLDGSNVQQLTTEMQYYDRPRWASNADWIYVAVGESFSDQALYRMRPDGSEYQLFWDNVGDQIALAFVQDGVIIQNRAESPTQQLDYISHDKTVIHQLTSNTGVTYFRSWDYANTHQHFYFVESIERYGNVSWDIYRAHLDGSPPDLIVGTIASDEFVGWLPFPDMDWHPRDLWASLLLGLSVWAIMWRSRSQRQHEQSAQHK